MKMDILAESETKWTVFKTFVMENIKCFLDFTTTKKCQCQLCALHLSMYYKELS